jgi:hypothetical protein
VSTGCDAFSVRNNWEGADAARIGHSSEHSTCRDSSSTASHEDPGFLGTRSSSRASAQDFLPIEPFHCGSVSLTLQAAPRGSTGSPRGSAPSPVVSTVRRRPTIPSSSNVAPKGQPRRSQVGWSTTSVDVVRAHRRATEPGPSTLPSISSPKNRGTGSRCRPRISVFDQRLGAGECGGPASPASSTTAALPFSPGGRKIPGLDCLVDGRRMASFIDGYQVSASCSRAVSSPPQPPFLSIELGPSYGFHFM